jgi:hypothetical protein
VRGWAKKHRWDERLEGVGDAAEAYAVRYYREVWFPRLAMREISVVEPNMRISFHHAEPVPDGPVSLQEDPGPLEDRAPSTGVRAQAAHELDNDETRRTVRRHLSLLDALIGKAATFVLNGDLKINSVNDLARALKVRADLAELMGDIVAPTTAGAAPQVEETYRVRRAVSEGGDILDARLADAQEAVALLQGMKSARGVAAEMKEAQEAPEEASAK